MHALCKNDEDCWRVVLNKRIYVAGPYSGSRIDRHINTQTAISVGIALVQKGWYPFIPHLSHYVDILAQDHRIAIPYRMYMEWDDAYLRICDAFLYVWHSSGADEEMERAHILGLEIYTHLDDVPNLSTSVPKKRIWNTWLEKVYERWNGGVEGEEYLERGPYVRRYRGEGA